MVPKSLREAMRLSPGQAVEIVYSDGRLEIEIAPAAVRLDASDGFPVLRPEAPAAEITTDEVRQVLEETRR